MSNGRYPLSLCFAVLGNAFFCVLSEVSQKDLPEVAIGDAGKIWRESMAVAMLPSVTRAFVEAQAVFPVK